MHGAWRALRGLRQVDGTHHVTVTDVVGSAADTSVGDVDEATVYAIWQALDIIRPVPAYTGFTEPCLVTAWLRERIGLRIAAVTEARHWHNGHRGPDADSLLDVCLHFTARPPTRLHGLGDELFLHTEDPYPSYDMAEHGTTLVGPACAPDLLDSGLPVTVLRPSKVHGQGAAPPREWYFVKRVLDRRPTLLLAGHGRGADHPSAAVNIAALVEVVAERPGRRILNAADPDAPDGLTISRVIAALTGHAWDEVLLDEQAPPQLGRHPWHRNPPIVLDTSAARALGYRPVGEYATTVTDEIDWLVGQVARHPTWTPPGVDPETTTSWFDYSSEDAWLRATQRSSS